MLIRKNTKAFKTIREIIESCKDRNEREKLIRLYITKAGHSIEDRISVEGIQGDTSFFYDMNYQTILSNLDSANHQLHVSDKVEGIYFFHSTSNKVWDEAPFEFDAQVVEEFSSLPELPAVRKKGKVEKYVFPAQKSKKDPPPSKKRSKAENKRDVSKIEKGPKQPSYKLKHDITFSNLEKTIFRKGDVRKQDVLNYYNGVAEYIVPYLKDRRLWSRITAGSSGDSDPMTHELLFTDDPDAKPAWIKTAADPDKQTLYLLANDKEHLLYYVESGLVQFEVGHSKIKSYDLPDYTIISIDSPESELGEAITVAKITNEVLTGLELPSFVMTDGHSGLHVYIPLDSKSQFEIARRATAYICKLIALRIPDLVVLKMASSHSYGKVVLNYSINDLDKGVIAPYSLLHHDSPTVATPILWDEVNDSLRVDAFNHETVIKRLKRIGDPFKDLFKRKVNAEALLTRLEKNYSFLFDEQP
jgi:bifunctional non-homologous end joining protein LigD